MEVKAALVLKEEKRKKAKVEIIKERKWTAKAEERAILAFKSSKELDGIKIEFAHEAFGKGFDLCKKKIVEKFPGLDLGFLLGDSFDDEVGPSTGTDLPPTELAADALAPPRSQNLPRMR
ncbi:hypothetical protein COCNU_scaffold000425G000010 [Cocos nucifera]|nr:hypothetical protein [Cocos nucifera]